MKVFFILITFFGAGHSDAYDTMKFDTIEECMAAKDAIANHFVNEWSGPADNELVCLKVEVKN